MRNNVIEINSENEFYFFTTKARDVAEYAKLANPIIVQPQPASLAIHSCQVDFILGLLDARAYPAYRGSHT
ncbi:hypothetical protein [Candidatus Nitrotoga sp. BS]|uniref:hypothetical protein n=1 Tax=Candidatus Nitrotoga sp. BS TaxID=2890408 RepID=UPI001EF1BFE2|nr:hypothetical protein [Candidatus Nitrotoga sp. BS]